MTTAFTAASCYARHHLGHDTIPVTSTGNVTLFIDTWSVNVTSTHNLTLAYTDGLFNFNITVDSDGQETQLMD